MNNVSFRCDMTEILLKAALNTIQSINQSKKLKRTTEMWLLKDLKIRLHRKHCGKR